MKNEKHFLFGLFLFLALSGIASAKDWRGIVPLHSTLEDVERLMGKSPTGAHYVYETDEGQVIFFYQSNPDAICGKGGKRYKPYNVPFGTVLWVQIESKSKPLLADLNFDLSKFKRDITCFGAFSYSNVEEGFAMQVYDGRVSTFYYQPTPTDAKQFACPKANEQKANGS